MVQNKRRKKFIGTPLQKKLLFLILASAIIPAGIVAACLYYLIFNLLVWQVGIPEVIGYNILPVARKVNLIIGIALPIILWLIWAIALELSHRISGPLLRLEKELDARFLGQKSGRIYLRKNDEFKPLAERINRLISPPSKRV